MTWGTTMGGMMAGAAPRNEGLIESGKELGARGLTRETRSGVYSSGTGRETMTTGLRGVTELLETSE
jgi:hypothetical protein